MKHKYGFVTLLLFAVALAGFSFTGIYVRSQEKEEDGFLVVTSFYPMYIAAENIVGEAENVTLKNLSEPQTGCMHDYQLTPEDMKLLGGADVFIVNGGGIETFLAKVAEAYPELLIVDASAGIDMEEDNSHVWMSVPAHMKQVENIARALCGLDEENREYYERQKEDYLIELSALKKRQEEIRLKIQGEKFISFHEAYDYVARDFGLTSTLTLDLDEERQVSAGEVADVLSAIRNEDISVIFAEEIYGSEMAQTVKKEADVTVCYLETIVRGDYEPDSYLKNMTENIRLIGEAYGVE
ncbi:MAG: metal ABC transporter substrate-binding protein [Roseburia sp.]|nr:metal ABC transporter substrate-binding protein [Roseburia sp.]